MANEMMLMAVGDIQLTRPEWYIRLPGVKPLLQHDPDPYSWLVHVAPILQQGDFVLANLEGPICELDHTDEGKELYAGASMKMPPETANALKRAGIHWVNQGNNHAMDYGVAGLVQTLGNLDRVGIAYSGAGRNAEEALKPAVLEHKGLRVALLAYTSIFIPGRWPAGENKPGLATISVSTCYEVPSNVLYHPGVPARVVTIPDPSHVERMVSQVRKAKQEADLVVVNFHWGTTKLGNAASMKIPLEEGFDFIATYQEQLGRTAIDVGADFVLGSHPHRLQGMEIYKNKLICYCLGAFAISYNEGPNVGFESLILKCHIDPKRKAFTGYTALPVRLDAENVEPRVIAMDEAPDIVALMERLSRKYGTQFRKEGQEMLITG